MAASALENGRWRPRAPALEHDYQTQRLSLAQGVAHNGAAGAGHGGDRVKAQRARAMALDLVGNDAQRGELAHRELRGLVRRHRPARRQTTPALD